MVEGWQARLRGVVLSCHGNPSSDSVGVRGSGRRWPSADIRLDSCPSRVRIEVLDTSDESKYHSLYCLITCFQLSKDTSITLVSCQIESWLP